MRETSNYKLSQWDKTDRIQMEDFNSDNAKIDAALGTLAEQMGGKATPVDIAAAQMWVKIDGITLSKANTLMATVVPQLEQYRQLKLLYNESGSNTGYLYWNGAETNQITYAVDGEETAQSLGGILITLGKGNTLLLHPTSYTWSNSNDYTWETNSFTRLTTTGSIKVGLISTSGSFQAGSSLTIYGLKR